LTKLAFLKEELVLTIDFFFLFIMISIAYNLLEEIIILAQILLVEFVKIVI